jgi:hypothetical protein
MQATSGLGDAQLSENALQKAVPNGSSIYIYPRQLTCCLKWTGRSWNGMDALASQSQYARRPQHRGPALRILPPRSRRRGICRKFAIAGEVVNQVISITTLLIRCLASLTRDGRVPSADQRSRP